MFPAGAIFVDIPFLRPDRIALPVVGTDRAAARHTLFHKGLHVARPDVPDQPHADPPNARPIDLRANDHHAARLFPEIRYPPQRGRVHLDGALQGVFPRHSAPQLVPPDPGGLVAGEREQTLQFQGAAAPPGPGDALDGPKPEPQWLAGPFEDRARRRRRLPVAGAALETCALQTPALPAAAMRAAKAVRPAQLDQVIAAGGLGREAGCQLGRGVAIVRHPASMLADCAPPSQVTVYRAASVRLPRRRRGAAAACGKRAVHVLFWGGMRGAVALALALGLPPTLPEREAIITISFAVVAFSVFAQGLTMPPVLRRMGEIHPV